MTVKVAGICPTSEKEWKNGKLVHHHVQPELSADAAYDAIVENLERRLPLLDKAAEFGAKMACLPEGFLENFWIKSQEKSQTDKVEMAKRTWELFRTRLGEAAKRLDMVIVAGDIEPEGKDLFNSAAVFTERGEIAGIYRKVQLAPGEDERLVRGREFAAFPTRYGKVGCCICWDIIYPEVTQSLMLNGAEIIFQPTWGHAGPQADFTIQARAHDACTPIVVSMWCGNGRIVDRDGTILAKCGQHRDWCGLIPDQIIYADIDPKAKREWIGIKDLRSYLKKSRQVHAYAPLVEPREE